MRRNPIVTLPNSEARRLQDVYASSFGKDWLRENSNHPLGMLWCRDEAIATMELLTIGWSIDVMSCVDPQWLRRQIELARSANANQCQGALFEIIALAAFAGIGHAVVPAPDSNPGYDGIVTAWRSERSYQISLKRHGPSIHEYSFTEQCKLFEREFVRRLHEFGLVTAFTSIQAKHVLTLAAWSELSEYVGSDKFKTVADRLEIIHDCTADGTTIDLTHWQIRVARFYEEGLSRAHSTYLLHVTAPEHPNEYKNLQDKLETAMANFRRHARDLLGLILLRLPAKARVPRITEWLGEFLRDQRSDAIDVAMLYQPSIRRNGDTGTALLTLYIDEIEKPGCRIAGVERRTNFFVGTIVDRPYRSRVGFDPMDENYDFQAGNFYFDPFKREHFRLAFLNEGFAGTPSTRVSSPFDGVHFHEVRRNIFGKEKLVSPKISQDNALLVL